MNVNALRESVYKGFEYMYQKHDPIMVTMAGGNIKGQEGWVVECETRF